MGDADMFLTLFACVAINDSKHIVSSVLSVNLSVCVSQNDVKTLRKWMADVDVFLNEEWPALGDSEALQKQLEQCTVRTGNLLSPSLTW